MLLSKLIDALKQKFKTPQEAVKALGLDEKLLEVPAKEKPKEFKWGFDRFAPKAFDFSKFAKDGVSRQWAVIATGARGYFYFGDQDGYSSKQEAERVAENARKGIGTRPPGTKYEVRVIQNPLWHGAKDDVQTYTVVVRMENGDRKSLNIPASSEIEARQNAKRSNKGIDEIISVKANKSNAKDDANIAPSSELTKHEKRGEKSAKTPGGHVIFKPAAMDAGRLIQVITGSVGSVKVYYDSEWKEFVCKPVSGKGSSSWHHTDDKDDAIGTAKVMSNDPRYF